MFLFRLLFLERRNLRIRLKKRSFIYEYSHIGEEEDDAVESDMFGKLETI